MKGFDSKITLAKSVEGLKENRVKMRIRNWILGVATFLFLATSVVLGANFFGGTLLYNHLAVGEIPAAEKANFRKMGLLPNAKRVDAPNFFLRTRDGKNRTLQQDRGKVVLINFWATWCLPCLREMPAMQRVFEKFMNDGLQIVAISVDQGRSDVVWEFVKNLNLKFQILLDPEHTAKRAYQVKALPTTYLIDRVGRVVAYGMGARKWDGEAAFALIESLLKEAG